MTKTNYKPLGSFYIASAALMIAGFVMNGNSSYGMLFALLFYNFLGIFFVYRINDSIDQHLELKFRLIQFFSNSLHLFLFIIFIISIPFSIYTISFFSFICMALFGFIGLFYSLTFTYKQKKYRVKNLFLFKNVIIGICWGGLVLMGAGSGESENVWLLFEFTTTQVMIGSIIRDIPDIKKDKEQQVHSMPLVMGTKQTYIYMHFLNLASLAWVYLSPDWKLFEMWFFAVIVFRAFTLFRISFDINSRFWTQTMNLFTCVIIMVVTLLIQKIII